jgi:hypothetical protein
LYSFPAGKAAGVQLLRELAKAAMVAAGIQAETTTYQTRR